MPRDESSTGRSRPGILGALRQAVSGGTAFGGRGTVPEGRAERLGLAEVPPGASAALALPMEFLGLGQDAKARAELAGHIGGLGARVFEFSADEMTGSGGEGAGSWDTFAYRVAAVELGFGLPWFAIALRRVPSPTQRIYPGRRGHDLDTGDRKTDRAYQLHTGDPAAASASASPVGAASRTVIRSAAMSTRPLAASRTSSAPISPTPVTFGAVSLPPPCCTVSSTRSSPSMAIWVSGRCGPLFTRSP